MKRLEHMSGKFERVIIASDMDGTFLAQNEAGMKRNLEAIDYFKSKGGRFTFATGRSYLQILKDLPNAPKIVNMPVVACNGASLYDLALGEELEGHLIDYAIIADLDAFLKTQAEHVGIRCGTKNGFFFNHLDNPYILADYEAMNPNCRAVLPVEEWSRESIYKLAVRTEQELLTQLRAAITERYRGALEVTQSYPTLVDIQAAGRTKAAMLRELMAKSEPSAFLCVAGDYDNDLEMLALADLPCCPSNAVDCVKAVCKHCFCDCEDGLIADVIEYLDGIF